MKETRNDGLDQCHATVTAARKRGTHHRLFSIAAGLCSAQLGLLATFW